ncbi:hypothetical protein BD779DRAFT_259080 [Infundibulicybe gibba]|nr:hypothetical protein BD779DRAFT_259080 [Infundibulicybe gibba]
MKNSNSPVHQPSTNSPQPTSAFNNQDFTFAESSTFNQISGDLHDGDETHIYGGAVGSGNDMGSGNITRSNNTSTSGPRAGSTGQSNNANGHNLRH